MSKRLAQLFDRAADHLEKYGWMKDDFFENASRENQKPGESYHEFLKRGGRRKPCCAMGVLHAVAKDEAEYHSLLNEFEAGIPSIQRGYYYAVHEWNDAPSRRKADVVRAFRRAAERQRSGK